MGWLERPAIAPVLPGWLERPMIALVLLGFAFGGYFWIAAHTDASSAASLATPLDARIPFLPASILVYAGVYGMITLPIFLIESAALFRRVAVAYAFVVSVCLVCFVWFPVSGAELRPDLTGVDAHPFLLWGLDLSYRLDPPVNLFPSLHLGGATIAALAVGKARVRDGVLACAGIVPVAVSVCTVKQHFWVDAVAGVALALLAFGLFLWRYAPPPGERRGRGGRGWAAFGAFAALGYGAAYTAFRLGLGAPG